MRKYLFLLILTICYLLITPFYCQAQQFQLPGTIDDIKAMFQKLIEAIFTIFPNEIKKNFQKGWGIIKKVLEFLLNIWNKYLWGTVKKVLDFFIYQIKYRLTIFKTEFKKELQELVQEIINLLKKIF